LAVMVHGRSCQALRCALYTSRFTQGSQLCLRWRCTMSLSCLANCLYMQRSLRKREQEVVWRVGCQREAAPGSLPGVGQVRVARGHLRVSSVRSKTSHMRM
jgi:hypothetical protein